MEILKVILLILLNMQMLLLVVANGLPALKKWLVKNEPLSKSEEERQARQIREMQNFFSYTGDKQTSED